VVKALDSVVAKLPLVLLATLAPQVAPTSLVPKLALALLTLEAKALPL
jgi:hypothetical protein